MHALFSGSYQLSIYRYTYKYKQSLDTGELPLEWKSAYVTPVFKKDKRSDPSNYQPVSLTVLCKTFEHILVSQIMNHLETHQILFPNQFGFRTKHTITPHHTRLFPLHE